MDDAELREQLERLHTASFGWALACCDRDATAAENALQSTYVKILEGRARFEGRSSFRTWLFGVIRRTAAEERRRSLVRRILLLRAGPVAAMQDESPEETSYRSEIRDQLIRALASLPRRQREIIELVFYHELTLDEAAGVIGISAGSARVHYARAKAKLREMMQELRERDESRRTRAANVV